MKTAVNACSTIGKGLLNLVYPLECQICRVPLGPFKESSLCDKCKGKIRLNLAPFCIKCGRSLINSTKDNNCCRECSHRSYYFQRSWAAANYEGVLKEAIHSFKFGAHLRLLPIFTELVINFAMRYIDIDTFDVVVPVPLHKTKLREREFNQAQLLAKDFSDKKSLPINSWGLKKIRNTKPQTEFNKDKRRSNIKNAFKVTDSSCFKDKKILLMDDVFTTGSTLNECAKMLTESGAKSVECLVVARG